MTYDIMILYYNVRGVLKMKCPKCGAEMEKGGIVSDSMYIVWYPLETYEKNLIQRTFTIGKRIGKTTFFNEETKIPDAYYCEKCNIVTGVFKVEEY